MFKENNKHHKDHYNGAGGHTVDKHSRRKRKRNDSTANNKSNNNHHHHHEAANLMLSKPCDWVPKGSFSMCSKVSPTTVSMAHSTSLSTSLLLEECERANKLSNSILGSKGSNTNSNHVHSSSNKLGGLYPLEMDDFYINSLANLKLLSASQLAGHNRATVFGSLMSCEPSLLSSMVGLGVGGGGHDDGNFQLGMLDTTKKQRQTSVSNHSVDRLKTNQTTLSHSFDSLDRSHQLSNGFALNGSGGGADQLLSLSNRWSSSSKLMRSTNNLLSNGKSSKSSSLGSVTSSRNSSYEQSFSDIVSSNNHNHNNSNSNKKDFTKMEVSSADEVSVCSDESNSSNKHGLNGLGSLTNQKNSNCNNNRSSINETLFRQQQQLQLHCDSQYCEPNSSYEVIRLVEQGGHSDKDSGVVSPLDTLDFRRTSNSGTNGNGQLALNSSYANWVGAISGIDLGFEMTSTQEINLRLLVLTIQWIKNMPLFANLSLADQKRLFEESWKELFIINLAHWTITINMVSPLAHVDQTVDIYVDSLVGEGVEVNEMNNEVKVNGMSNKTNNNNQTKDEEQHRDEKYGRLSGEMREDMHHIEDIIERFKKFSPDGTECACLKAIALFKPESQDIVDRLAVEKLQDQAQCVLNDYVSRKAADNQQLLMMSASSVASSKDESRFGKLLLLLPILRKINTSTIERIFFHDVIGSQLSIRDIIDEIYRQ